MTWHLRRYEPKRQGLWTQKAFMRIVHVYERDCWRVGRDGSLEYSHRYLMRKLTGTGGTKTIIKEKPVSVTMFVLTQS